MTSEVHLFSTLTGKDLDLGVPTDDLDTLLELGDMMATNRPDVIVHVEGPALQKWTGT